MIENRRLLLPYAGPYFAYVLFASLFENILPVWLNDSLCICSAVALLAWAWRWYIPLWEKSTNTMASLAMGLLYGAFGCLLWIALLSPFASQTSNTPWEEIDIIVRLLAAGLVVPIFEELMVRGYAFRLALQWDRCRREGALDPLYTVLHEQSIDDVHAGEWSWAAIWISTLVFMLGHTVSEWPAALCYGVLMCQLLIIRKDLLSCIIAHAVTNVCLVGYIYLTGRYNLW
ncbi:MAG: CPBP family intramembrane metalloprotease [Desulfobulbus propionicus]|nr:MAG: CPBP family intramembrane metalloprotease [Desulfobulbus propionicus]